MWKYDRKEIWNMVFYLVSLSRVHAFSSWPVHARSFTLRWLNLTFFLIHKSCGHTRLKKGDNRAGVLRFKFRCEVWTMSSPLIKIVEQPSMTSQQTREIKVLSLLDRFLKTRSYSLPTEKGLQRSQFEVKNAAQSSGKHRPCVILFRMTSLLEVLT